MVKILTKARTLITAIIAMIVLTVSRVLVMLNGIDYSNPNGLFSREGDIYNIIFYILLAVSAVAIIVTAWLDTRDPEKAYVTEIKDGRMTAIGGSMIAVGAVEALAVMSEFAAGLNIFSLFVIIGCICFVVGGVIIASAKEMTPLHSLPVAFIILSYVAQAIRFYMNNPLISKIPQKLMLMGFLISTAFFWVYFGRMLSGDKKPYTRIMAVSVGYFSTAMTVAYIASSFILLGVDAQKWMKLTNIPGIVLIPAAVVPSVIATIILFSRTEATAVNAVKTKEQTLETGAQESNDDIDNIS